MARIEWAQLCELAFVDNSDRLCMVGVILITVRNLPLYHEGMYRFELSLDAGTPIALNIPVLLVSTPRRAEIH